MVIAISLHILAAIIWVGGMFFAYVVLRPAAGILQPPDRLRLLEHVFIRFFRWVWIALLVLFSTGLWMVLVELGGFLSVEPHIHAMMCGALVMTLIFLHVYFSSFQRLRKAVAGKNWPAAGAAGDQIRQLVFINLIIGLVTVCIATTGSYWG